MSLDIFGQAIDALRRGEPMQVRLPNGTVVTGVPELTEDEDGPLVLFHVHSDGHAGSIEGTLRMRPETFKHMLDKTEAMLPRLTAVRRAHMLR